MTLSSESQVRLAIATGSQSVGTELAALLTNVSDGTFTSIVGTSVDTATLKLSSVTVTASAAEINGRVTGQPSTATLAAAAGASTEAIVTITVKDGAGVAVTAPVTMHVMLSDASTGLGITGTTASGAVAAGDTGSVLLATVSKKLLMVQTSAAGVFKLSITDSAKTQFYVVVNVPGCKPVVARVLTANYGA